MRSLCYMTHPYLWHDTFLCVTWLMQGWVMSCLGITHGPKANGIIVWHVASLRVTWLMPGWVMSWHTHNTRAQGKWGNFVTWLIPVCDVTHVRMSHVTNSLQITQEAKAKEIFVWRDASLYVTWCILICDKSYVTSHMWQVICDKSCVTSPLQGWVLL